MNWRDEVASGLVVKRGVAQPAEAKKQFAEFFIGALLLLIALGGFAM
jgi:hypothetical protein